MAKSKTPQQLVFNMIKYWAPVIDHENWEMQKAWLFTLSDSVKKLTPRQFEQIFPIDKQFKGRQEGWKDYYSVTDWIGENVGFDNKIPDGIEFIFEYLNSDVQIAAVKAMGIISKLHRRQTGKDMLLEFLKEQGIHVNKLHKDGDC